ncbi:MAG: hypothetical protein ACK4YP_03660 [Myxococcota bacterium]
MISLLLLLACTGAVDDKAPGDTADADTDTDADTDADTDTDTDTDTATDTGLDPATVPLDGECADAAHWGAFSVASNEDYAYVTGAVSDGVVPASVLTNVLTSGDCVIWRRENPFCDPGCDPGYTCDFDGTCVPYPTAQDLGDVTVTGLFQPVTMTPVTPGYTYFDTSLDNPPWEPGALVTLASEGGAYAPFTLHGVAPVTLAPVTMEWIVTEGEPLAVAWDAPTGPVRTEVVLTLRIDQHGLTPSNIECVFADDGAAEVPADVLASLMEYGVSGFPAGDLARRTVDSADVGEGCVDLALTSSRLANITITGYTPCRDDRDCPDALTCNEAMERCE